MSIGDDHVEFGKAVVRLAREHKMDSLVLSFRRSIPEYIGSGDARIFDTVHLTWASGRHGVRDVINLRSEEHMRLNEDVTT